MTEGPVALFDLDGTLADFDGAMKAAFDRTGLPGNYTDAEYKVVRRLIKTQAGFWEGLPIFQLGFNLLSLTRKLGYHDYILSKGPESIPAAWSEKVRWVRTFVPGTHGIILTEDKSLVYGRVLVDDWPDYYIPWLKTRPRGLVVAVAHPWNDPKNRPEAAHPQVIRYDGTNLEEVSQRLVAAANAEKGE